MQEAIKAGNIVYFKREKRRLAEVISVTDDTAVVKLCDTELVVSVAVEELGLTACTQNYRKSGTVVHILGVPYKILIIEDEDYRADREADGWCDTSAKELLVFNFKQSWDSKRDLVAYQHKVIRHEIVHAFLYESGLDVNSLSGGAWAKNEEMVDWMAIQIPKILKAFQEAGIAEEVYSND